ncbi:MAG: ABC transporter permease [Ignisphaera sp.]
MEISEAKKLWFIASRDLERFINSKYWLAGQIAMNLADIFIFALVLRGFIRREFVPDYLQYMTPGAIALATFVASFSIGREVGMEVRREIVDYLLTLPVKRTTLVFGRIFSGMLRGLVYQLPFILIAILLVSLPPINRIPILLLTSVILTITMSSLAIAVSTISRDFNIQATFRAVTYYLLFFFSNVFYTKKALELRFPQPLPDLITLTPISLSADIYRWCFNYYTTLEISKLFLLMVWGLILTTLAATIYLKNLTKR